MKDFWSYGAWHVDQRCLEVILPSHLGQTLPSASGQQITKQTGLLEDVSKNTRLRKGRQPDRRGSPTGGMHCLCMSCPVRRSAPTGYLLSMRNFGKYFQVTQVFPSGWLRQNQRTVRHPTMDGQIIAAGRICLCKLERKLQVGYMCS